MDLVSQGSRAARQGTRAASRGVEKFARVGFLTKGIVYIILGVLSVQAAVGPGAAKGGKGAIQTIGQQPFGAALLIVTALGLAAYALWRAVQAVLDPEQVGKDPKGLLRRLGYALSGLSHAGLAIVAVQMVTGAGSGGEGGRKTFLAQLMSETGGQVIVGVLAGFVILVGLRQLYKAKTTKFTKELKSHEMSASVRRAAVLSGRIGLTARGVVFPIIGFYLFRAAMTDSAWQAKGVGGALREIGSSPFGTTMLVLVAGGLVAYGAYQLVLAKYRRIPAPG